MYTRGGWKGKRDWRGDNPRYFLPFFFRGEEGIKIVGPGKSALTELAGKAPALVKSLKQAKAAKGAWFHTILLNACHDQLPLLHDAAPFCTPV